MYFICTAMVASPSLFPLAGQARPEVVHDWPYLTQPVLVASRSRQVCLTCRFFGHQAAADAIPLLTCQLHRGLIAHGEHLTRRCQGWCHGLDGWPG